MSLTLVLGASLKSDRYSYMAVLSLLEQNHEVVGVGLKEGIIDGARIYKGLPDFDNVDTVTLYLNAKRQELFYNYVVSLKPRRVIFNPGTYNGEFENILKENNIAFENACTLVLLSTGQY